MQLPVVHWIQLVQVVLVCRADPVILVVHCLRVLPFDLCLLLDLDLLAYRRYHRLHRHHGDQVDPSLQDLLGRLQALGHPVDLVYPAVLDLLGDLEPLHDRFDRDRLVFLFVPTSGVEVVSVSSKSHRNLLNSV